MMPPAPSVLQYLEIEWPHLLNRLSECLRIPSISTLPSHRADIECCADWWVQEFTNWGLQARKHSTSGHPVVIAATPARTDTTRPRVLIYGHYDVQPPGPLGAWVSPPFSPVVREGRLFARGASDNKGQTFAHLAAVASYLRTNTPLPCDVVFVLEGEEEVGSRSFPAFLNDHRDELACDVVVISDTNMPALTEPALVVSLRGLASLEVTVTGPATELHSGIHGGAVENPAAVLCRLLATFQSDDGRVCLSGFEDGIHPLSISEREALDLLTVEENCYCEAIGVPALRHDPHFSIQERLRTRPTFEIHGLYSGYTDVGIKTIIPSTAQSKISCRLVPNQEPEDVLAAMEALLHSVCPKTVRLSTTRGFCARPYRFNGSSSLKQLALDALSFGFDGQPICSFEGVTIPVVPLLREVLKAEALLVGFALPEDNMHAPNESISLEALKRGMQMSACLLGSLGNLESTR